MVYFLSKNIILLQGVANDEADLFRARFGGYGGGGGGCNGGGGGGGFLGGKGGQNGSENGQGGISYVDTNFVIWHSLDTRHCLLEDEFSQICYHERFIWRRIPSDL